MTTAPDKGFLPGISRAIREINAQLAALAKRADDLVFLTGEPGTERALAARLLHQHSDRARKPFVRLLANWKLPPDFGAQLENANGGTVYVSLVREFPVDMQYTFLEIANDRTFTDPLSGESRAADVRLILTTTLDLETLFGRSPLLPDLREILMRAHIEVPSLRERREDIPALVRFALQRARESCQSRAEEMDRQVVALLRTYPWPGNAEELLLVAAQAALKAAGPLVTIADLPEEFVNLLAPETVRMARSIEPTLAGAVETPQEQGTGATAGEAGGAGAAAIGGERETGAAALRAALPLREALSMTPVPLPRTPPPAGPEEYLAAELEEDRRAPTEPPTPRPEAPIEAPAETAADAANEGATVLGLAEPVEVLEPGAGAAAGAVPGAPFPGARPLSADPASAAVSRAGTAGPQGILSVASRLYAQSALLARQMQGPLPAGAETAREIAAARGSATAPASPAPSDIEAELTRGLEQILALRRQLAILNQREQDSASTIRDLLQRLELGTETPEPGDFRVLSSQMAEIDAIIERVTERLPKISEDLQKNIRRLLGQRGQE